MRTVVSMVMTAVLLIGCGDRKANGQPAPVTDTVVMAVTAAPDVTVTSDPDSVETPTAAAPLTEAQAAGISIVTAARRQVGQTLYYDPTYVRIAYPMGDVPIEVGVCTDVVIRALRDALKMDLQQLVHKDMTAAFSEYPNNWGLKKPDTNIDHRRVPNLRKYFSRKGYSLAITDNPENYLPGDIVTCTLPGNIPHIMLVSDRKTREGVPLAIHNIGGGAKEEDRLFDFIITGHFRLVR